MALILLGAVLVVVVIFAVGISTGHVDVRRRWR